MNAYEAALETIRAHEKPQDVLFAELIKRDLRTQVVFDAHIRILLQTILDMRAERDAGYSNVA